MFIVYHSLFIIYLKKTIHLVVCIHASTKIYLGGNRINKAVH